MSIHIVIDGYNLIRQSRSLQAYERTSLARGRDALLDALAAYRKLKNHPITVVFDGTDAPQASDQRARWKGIDIVFSRRGQSADQVIKKMAARDAQQVVVVTSDRELSRGVAHYGAAIIESVDFEKKMAMVALMNDVDFGIDPDDEGWSPSTKKKGPSRRPSKRQRRYRVKTEKL